MDVFFIMAGVQPEQSNYLLKVKLELVNLGTVLAKQTPKAWPRARVPRLLCLDFRPPCLPFTWIWLQACPASA